MAVGTSWRHGLDEVHAWLSKEPLSRVIDFGCGGGKLGRFIRELSPSAMIIGVDGSREAIKLQTEVTPQVYNELALFDLNNLVEKHNDAFPGEWDLWMFGDVLEHVPEETARAILSLSRSRLVLFRVPVGVFPQEATPFDDDDPDHGHLWTFYPRMLRELKRPVQHFCMACSEKSAERLKIPLLLKGFNENVDFRDDRRVYMANVLLGRKDAGMSDLSERLAKIRVMGGESEAPAEVSSVRIAKIVNIQTDRLHPDDMNANEQSPETFNGLTQEIGSDEFDEPLQVCECSCEKIEGAHYVISGGEHRWKAARYHGMKELPCVIKPWDEQTRRLKMVARNLRRGELNDRKFTKLVEWLKNEDPQKTQAELALALGFDNEAEYLRHLLVKEDKAQEQSWLKEAMGAAGDEVDAVAGLTDVLNHIFSEYGDTVPQSFLFFSYKGKTHLMLLMNEAMFDEVQKVVDMLRASGKNMNDVMLTAFQSVRGKEAVSEEKA